MENYIYSTIANIETFINESISTIQGEMKKLTIFLLIALMIPIVCAIEPSLNVISANCDNTGNIVVEVSHDGRPVYSDKVTVSTTHKYTKEKTVLSGDWYFQNEKTNLIGRSSTIPESIIFKTTDGSLSKNGEYKLIIDYFTDTVDEKISTATMKFNCPGKTCLSSSMCNHDEYCNNGSCNYLQCGECEKAIFHACIPKCADEDTCTADYCKEGVCLHEKLPGCCITSKDCYDGRGCTLDKCADNRCVNQDIACNENKGPCVSGACVEPKGCVYTTDSVCLEKENEKRKYFIYVNDPNIQGNWLERMNAWLSSFFSNFFKQ